MCVMGERLDVTICAVPYVMELVEGGVLFVSRHGFAAGSMESGATFAYRSSLWYLSDTNREIPAAHLSKMHTLLERHVYKDNEGGNYAPDCLRPGARPPSGAA